MRIFRKKTLETILHESDKKTLKPTMRTFDLVLLGVGSVIGSGILVLTGEACGISLWSNCLMLCGTIIDNTIKR